MRSLPFRISKVFFGAATPEVREPRHGWGILLGPDDEGAEGAAGPLVVVQWLVGQQEAVV